MEDYYYRSNIRKELEDIAVSCLREETVIPYITESEDEIHNVHDKGYKYLFSVKKNFGVPSKSVIWLTEPMQQFFAKQS